MVRAVLRYGRAPVRPVVLCQYRKVEAVPYWTSPPRTPYRTDPFRIPYFRPVVLLVRHGTAVPLIQLPFFSLDIGAPLRFPVRMPTVLVSFLLSIYKNCRKPYSENEGEQCRPLTKHGFSQSYLFSVPIKRHAVNMGRQYGQRKTAPNIRSITARTNTGRQHRIERNGAEH